MAKKKKKKKKEIGRYFVILGIAVLALCIFFLIMERYTVKTITVEGNIHYTNDEIVNMVMKNRLDRNSLYLSLKYRKKGIEGIPFIEKMSVNILAPDTIKVIVYEKAVAGYIEVV